MQTILTLMLRTLKLNKKRTVITILTIVLSVGMITAVLCGSWSMLRYMQDKQKVYGGDYAYSISEISSDQAEALEDIPNISGISLMRFAGYSFYGTPSTKSQLALAEINDTFVKNFYLEQYLQDGTFPASPNEIVLTSEFIKDNRLSLGVGDSITLSIGVRIWDEIDTELYGLVNYLGELESFRLIEEKTYTITGIIAEPDGSKTASNFNAFTGMGAQSGITAYIKSSDMTRNIYNEARENAAQIGADVENFHSDLLMYYGITGGKGSAKIIVAVSVVILLLVAASSAMISNVLSISLQERIKQLGILASVGATSKQKRASVIYEALILGVLGIPVGIVFGVGLSAVVLAIIKKAFLATFSFGIISLTLKVHWLIFAVSVLAGISSLFLACRASGKAAANVSIIDTLRQSNIYHPGKRIRQGKLMSILFGVHGMLAAKNVRRNPKRFRSITCSIFLALVLGLSLYSLSDFMLYQTEMDMKEDGSPYTDVHASVPYQEVPTAIKAISDDNISADISYHLARYMTAEFSADTINPQMSGYFINGTLAELYVVGMDEEHFYELCTENGLDYASYNGVSNQGIMINSATGNYGDSPSKTIIGEPFRISSGTEINLSYAGENYTPVIIQDVIVGSSDVLSLFVRDRAVIIVPISYFQSMLEENCYIDLTIATKQHKECTDSLTDIGFFQVTDIASITENTRQVWTLFKLIICIFTVLMTLIISLNVCNTISNTIYVRKSEFAVLRSIGMTSKGLKRTLLLESLLYGLRALIFALPVCLLIHYAMYNMISKGMTPFVFYIDVTAYITAILAVGVIVCGAMLFSTKSVTKVDIVKELKTGSI